MRLLKNADITNKTVLLRVDFNVTLNKRHEIADDFRIQQTLPTIEFLNKHNNRIMLVTHLGDPAARKQEKFSLKPVAVYLQKHLPDNHVVLIDSFEKARTWQWGKHDILLLENIRFHAGEEKNDPDFARELASLADVYVNDAFGVSHRKHASVYGIAEHLPSYAGLLLEKEIAMIDAAVKRPKHPVVAILGGAKVSSKIHLIEKLMGVADTLLVGGGLANTFFAAEGYEVGTSFYEQDAKIHAKKLLGLAERRKTELLLPVDVVIGDMNDVDGNDVVVKPDALQSSESRAILDIGPETQALWGVKIAEAQTIIWNGPVGYMEHPSFSRGTDFIYYAISQNTGAVSVLGGGETLAAISKKEYLDHITHISTGGGAMLEYIEKGTLVGIEALDDNSV